MERCRKSFFETSEVFGGFSLKQQCLVKLSIGGRLSPDISILEVLFFAKFRMANSVAFIATTRGTTSKLFVEDF